MNKGTQIAYIPLHANGNILHPDVEFGFITSIRDDVAFCRYWSKYHPDELRTKANSEATPIDSLVFHVSQPQSKIDGILEQIAALEKVDAP